MCCACLSLPVSDVQSGVSHLRLCQEATEHPPHKRTVCTHKKKHSSRGFFRNACYSTSYDSMGKPGVKDKLAQTEAVKPSVPCTCALGEASRGPHPTARGTQSPASSPRRLLCGLFRPRSGFHVCWRQHRSAAAQCPRAGKLGAGLASLTQRPVRRRAGRKRLGQREPSSMPGARRLPLGGAPDRRPPGAGWEVDSS